MDCSFFRQCSIKHGKLRVFFSPPEEGNLKKSLKPKKKLGFFGKRIDFSVFNDTMKLSSFEI